MGNQQVECKRGINDPFHMGCIVSRFLFYFIYLFFYTEVIADLDHGFPKNRFMILSPK